jgi:drug/metabolite transporter (DMT)-like permease
VAHASLIMGVTPIVVLGLAVSMKLERLTSRKLTGMLVALAGIGILKAFETAGSGPTWLGDFLVFLAALTFSVFAAFGKKITARHSSITVNTFGYVGGAVFMAPLVIWQGWSFPFAQVSATAWLSVVYMALFPSLICYLIFYHAMSHIPVSRVSALSYFQPLLATLMAVSVLGERLTGSVVAGGAVILAGVWLAERG